MAQVLHVILYDELMLVSAVAAMLTTGWMRGAQRQAHWPQGALWPQPASQTASAQSVRPECVLHMLQRLHAR